MVAGFWRAGENVAIEYRGAEDQTERLPAFAAELVRRRVAIIVAFGLPAALQP
jgi:putative tryptophan/tyrosine transport system substrate-binding protein